MVSSPSFARGAARVALVVSLGGIALGALVAPAIPSSPPAAVALFPPGDTTTVYGPAQLSTPNGNPTNHVERFAVAVTPGRRYTLRLVNGAPNGSAKVTGGTVQLNGWETMTSGDLASGATLERVVQVRTEDTLFVTVQGPAGAYVTASVLATPDPSFLVFGPAHFIRTTGTPVTETRTFSISPTAAPPYRFCLKNGGDDGTNRVSSASIVLNGQEVFTQSQFNQHVASLMTQVTLQPANTLLVTLSGIPGGFLDLCVTATDITPPVITITAPPPNLLTRDTVVIVSGNVADETPTTVAINGAATTVSGGGAFTDTVALVEGSNAIHIVATDAAGHSTDSTRTVVRDRTPPVLTVNQPVNGFITNQASLPVSGSFIDVHAVTVNVNGMPLTVTGTTFSGSFLLAEGANVLLFNATDAAGNPAPVVMRTVKLDTQAPVIALNSPAEGDTIAADSATLVGTVTDANPKTLTANGIAIPLGQGGSFTGKVPLVVGLNTITLVATDSAANASAPFVRHVVRRNPLPPDPATVASVVNRAEATLIKENTAFLYTGATPIQTGVTPATIDTLRAAVVRGRVLDRTLQPLGGAVVKIKSHPEFGQTLSRADGGYDLVVNGGGSLVLDYSKGGYLPAQRTVEVPWQDYTPVEDVILIQPDAVVTVVDLTAPGITVARGSIQTDADSSRQATVFFEPGTQATLRRADGTTQVLTTLAVRATEFTVGANGGAAMPAELPPASEYTYAVQVTADAQLAAGPGAKVTFNQPVPLYVENFLDFPVGTKVPTGVYDPDSAKWFPRPNGVVLRITGTDAQGRALLDINGDGIADSDSLLLFNGIDPLERVKLAGTYPVNSRLWRVPIIETLPHDLNWPFTLLGGDAPKSRVTGPCGSEGADVLRCGLQVQTAFQSVGIVGSPFTLNYASDRTQGNVADRQLNIQLVGATIPPFLNRVDLEINIAGKQFETSFVPAANLNYTFVWDGKDAYGRTVQQTQPATVRIGYLYPVVYSRPAPVSQSFGLPCTLTAGDCTLDSMPPREEDVRALRRVWETLPTTLGGFDATGAGLGGFTLDVQHAYDPLGGILYGGDGTRRTAATLPDQITRFAGTGATGPVSDPMTNGVPATQSLIGDPAGIAVGPDGSVYFADRFRNRVRKVDPNGIISLVAGSGGNGAYAGDGGPATAAKLSSPKGLALGSDGSVYIADEGNQRIRRVRPDGIIVTFAGTGELGYNGDTIPATSAKLNLGQGFGGGLAVARDGSVYFADINNHRIRRIGLDGIITTIAGTGEQCFIPGTPPAAPGQFESTCLDNVPATRAKLRFPRGLAIGLDGSIYFSQAAGGTLRARIQRVDPQGIIHLVGGKDWGPTPVAGLGDGGSAQQAQFFAPWALGIGPDGSLYVSDELNESGGPGTGFYRVRRIRPDGLINTVVGDGVGGNSGDKGPARRARINRVEGITFLQDGSMLISDDAMVRKVTAPLPGLAGGQTVVVSEDGSELHVFSAAGRILLTLNAVTRDTIYTFGYDQNRRLISIRDLSGMVTRLERDTNGALARIVAPNGQFSAVTLDAGGNLAGLTGPDGRPVGFVLDAKGDLAATINQAGDTVARYRYDANGMVIGLTDARGGSTSYSTSGSSVTMQLPSNRTFAVSGQQSADGVTQYSQVLAGSMNSQTTYGLDGRTVITSPNGVVTTLIPEPDSRFGLQAVLGQETVRLPSGLTRVTRFGRGVTLSDPDDPLSVSVEIDSTVVNGRVSTTRFDKVASTVTTTSAGGRRTTATLDSLGRPTRITSTGGPTLERQLDEHGRVIQAKIGGRVTRYDYDSFDRLSSRTDVLGLTTTFVYDQSNQLLERHLPDGRVIRIGYDVNGNVTTVTPPSRPDHAFSHNTAGQLISYTAPDAGFGPGIVRYSYDSAGRPTSITRPDSSVITISYNSTDFGQVVLLPGNDTLKMVRSATNGNLSQATLTGGVSVAHLYDGPLPTSTTWSGPVQGTVATAYDTDFRLQSEQVNGASAVQFTYDADGLLTGAGALTLSRDAATGAVIGRTVGSVTSSATYQQGMELSSTVTKFGSDTLYAVVLVRDSAGRITRRTETVDHVTTVTALAYDSAAHLATVTRDGSVVEAYDYDANSNRVRATTTGGVLTATIDAQDRLIANGSVQYSYTSNGDLLRKVSGIDTVAYAYDAIGNLRRVQRSGLALIEYVVDAEGNRVGKRVNGALTRAWLYSGGVAVAELDGTGQVVSRFVYGDQTVPDYMVRAGATYRIVYDERGSVRLVVDVATGAVAQRLEYDGFGRVTLNTNSGFQPFGFAGGLYDDETGLVRFGARDYDASIGRWTAKDPIGFTADLNLYSYTFGDPINFTDVSGLEGNLIELEETQVINDINSKTKIQVPVYKMILRKTGCFVFQQIIGAAVTGAVMEVVYVASTGALDVVGPGALYIGRTMQELATRLAAHHRDLEYLRAIIVRLGGPSLAAIEATTAEAVAMSTVGVGARAAIDEGLIANLRWPGLGKVLKLCP